VIAYILHFDQCFHQLRIHWPDRRWIGLAAGRRWLDVIAVTVG